MDTNELLTSVCLEFSVKGKYISHSIFTEGLINASYLVLFEDEGQEKKYLVQSINTNVFRDLDGLMGNIVGVTRFLRDKLTAQGLDADRGTLNFLSAKNGKYYALVGEKHWRVYAFVDGSHTLSKIEDCKCFENAGRGFGDFLKNLDGYPSHLLFETIKDFHNTPKRMANLIASIEADAKGRAKDVKEEIEFALSRKDDAELALQLHRQGLIPLRVTHNDTKLNNILFDDETGDSVCVIDLDTIMPGLSLYDFGDAIRFGANTTAEDDPDLDNVKVSLELFESFAKGFLGACAKALTETEVKMLAFSAKLMTFECGIRFLTDYLDGDVYFKTKHENHNIDRARNQFRLVQEMEKHMDEMNGIIDRIYAEAISDCE